MDPNPDDAIRPGEPTPVPASVTPPSASTSWLPRGVAVGFVSGLIMGPLAGAASCWINESNDFLPHGALIGAAIGILLGPLIGWLERLRRPDFVRGDTATLIGIVFGLAYGVQHFLTGAGGVGGRGTGYFVIAMFFIGPMVGLFIGALLDRAFEALVRRDSVLFGVLALAASGGLVWYMITQPNGPDIVDLKKQVHSMLIEKWRGHPEGGDATIQKLILVRDRDGVYSGRVDATIAKQPVSFILDVTIKDSIVHAEWHPIEK